MAHSLDDDPTEKEEAQFNDFIDAIKQECNPKLKNSGFKPVKVYDGFDEDNEFNREIQFSVELEKHVKFGGDGVKSESVDELITEDADKQQGQYANFTKDQVKEMFGRAVNIVQLSVKKASSTVKSAEYKSSSKHLTIPGAIGMDYDVKAYVTVKHGDWTEKDGELSQFFNEIKDNFNRTIQGFRLKLEGDSNSETTIVIDYYRRFKYGATIKDDMGSMNDESLYDLLDEGFSLKKLNPFRQKEINCSKAQVVSEHNKALAILSAAANKVKNDPNHAEAKLRAYRESSKFPEAGNSNDVWVGVKLYHKEPDHRDDESVENMIQAIKSQCGPALKTLGFSLHVDGDFDSTTEIFVRRNVKAIYQK